MKVMCRTHGCHFPEEFDETLLPECTFWKDHGCQNLPAEDKRLVWDWYFGIDWDHFLNAYGYAPAVNFAFYPAQATGLFENIVPGYKAWPDDQRRAFQKQHFLKAFAETEARKQAEVDQMQDILAYNKGLMGSRWKMMKAKYRALWGIWRNYENNVRHNAAHYQKSLEVKNAT